MAQAKAELDRKGDAADAADQERLVTQGLNAVWNLGKFEVAHFFLLRFLPCRLIVLCEKYVAVC